jgi:hypothetical protein
MHIVLAPMLQGAQLVGVHSGRVAELSQCLCTEPIFPSARAALDQKKRSQLAMLLMSIVKELLCV